MKEHPILFSAPMVRVLLAGQKTQTRRAVKPVGNDGGFVLIENAGRLWPYRSDDGDSSFHTVKRDGNEYLDETPHECPYGQPGDRLWVKETFYAWGRWERRYSEQKARDEWHFIDLTESSNRPYRYAATDTVEVVPRCAGVVRWWKRPAIFMPRTAIRIPLEIVGIRVDRLQDISEADAIAEGVSVHPDHHGKPRSSIYSPVQAYSDLWESLNGNGSWIANPWVWVVEFRRVS